MIKTAVKVEQVRVSICLLAFVGLLTWMWIDRRSTIMSVGVLSAIVSLMTGWKGYVDLKRHLVHREYVEADCQAVEVAPCKKRLAKLEDYYLGVKA